MSGGAFDGNWLTSGVYMVSFDVRHNLGVPAQFGIRTAGVKGGYGTAMLFDSLVPPGVWTRLTLPVTEELTGEETRTYEIGNFTTNYASVIRVQSMIVAPVGYGNTTNAYKVDVDNVTIRIRGTADLGDTVFTTNSPTYDRWMYQFNFSDGNRATAPTYMTDDPRFDYRDAQAYFAFVLTNGIPAGLGAENYQILSARFTAVKAGGEAAYDDTQDPWQSYLLEADADAGRPVELYGAGWRGTNTAWSFGENGDFPLPPDWMSNTNAIWKEIRNVYALGFKDGVPVDVSNNIDPDGTLTNGFDPKAFAIGKTDLDPGDDVPDETVYTFDIDVADPNIQQYLAESLNDGILALVLSSLDFTTQGGPTGYPEWSQKESVLYEHSSLEITYRLGAEPKLAITVTNNVRAITWPRGTEYALLEATTNLMGNPVKWIPIPMQSTTNETHFVTHLPQMLRSNVLWEAQHEWYFRLVQP